MVNREDRSDTSKLASGNGNAPATARTTGAAPGGRRAIIVGEGSTAIRSRSDGVATGSAPTLTMRRGWPSALFRRAAMRGSVRNRRRVYDVPMLSYPVVDTGSPGGARPSRWPWSRPLRPCGTGTAHPVERLLAVLDREHAERDRDAGVERARVKPAAHSPATYSKCAVSPRITAPMQTTASTAPDAAKRFATSGNSNARRAPTPPGDLGRAVVAQRLLGARAQRLGHLVIEAGGDDREPHPRRVELAVGACVLAHQPPPSCASSSGSESGSKPSRCPSLRCLARRYAMFSAVGTVCTGTRSTISSP